MKHLKFFKKTNREWFCPPTVSNDGKFNKNQTKMYRLSGFTLNQMNTLIVIFLGLLSAMGQKTAVPEFDSEKALEDFNIYRTIVETAHSGIYLYTPKEEFDALFSTAQSQVPQLKSYREFYKLLASLHTQINCGHSSLYPTGSFFSELKSDTEKAFFPFKIKFLKDTLVAAQDYGDLKKGTQITSINGHSVAEITSEIFKLISSDGYNTTFKYRRSEADFSTYFFGAYGAQQHFEIEMFSYPHKKKQRVRLEGLSISELNTQPDIPPFTEPHTLEYLDNSTAVLTVNTFTTDTPKGQKRFFKFLSTSFKAINEKNIEHLVLDIRNNTGGDDGNDMELASYLINQHFKENKFRKLNRVENMPPLDQYLSDYWFEMIGISSKKREKIKALFNKMVMEEVEQGTDGAYYWKNKKIIHRDPAKYRFKGQAYVLTSGNVFSGGSLFASLVRDKSSAIFIGEETGGGYYRHTGSIPLIYQLPYSNLIFSLFIVINEQDVNQQLFPQGSGVVPHHTIYPGIKDFVAGTDVVMEKAKELIRQ